MTSRHSRSMYVTAGLPGAGIGRAAVLACGPLLTVSLLHQGLANSALHSATTTAYLVVALLFWSPLPFSLPAVLLDEHRDAVAAGRALPVRAALMLPTLLTRPGARLATAASLLGFALAAALVLSSLR